MALCAASAAALPTVPAFAASSPAAQAHSAPSSAAVCGTAAPGFARCLSLVRTDIAARSSSQLTPAVTPSGYGPASLQSAYNLVAASLSGGAGQTVAVVDAYDQPNAESDLAAYRSQFGLPACTTANGCFRKVNQSGGTSYPAANSGWGLEIALDLQMVSAICPNCHILLVEASSASFANLGTGVNRAVTMGAVAVSNSYAGPDSSNDGVYDSAFYNHPGVAITASSGDNGYGVLYPAASRYVVAVGGTTLTQGGGARGWTESAWSGAGSGCSAYEAKPAWQTDSGCTGRTVADVSAVADPNTGVAVYDTYGYGGWLVVGGTSASSPIIASTYALAGTPASGAYPGSYLYAADPANLYDVTSGSNGSCSPTYLCTGVTGYDGPTGLGTPDGIAAFGSAAPVTNNFSISASPTSVSVAQGASGTSTISTALVSGSAESISLAASGLPSGVTAGFSPASVSAGGSSTLTLTASGGATLGGPVTVTITGTAASAIHSTTLALTVTAPVSNVIVNGGFETGTFAGWTTSGAVTSIVTSPVHSGSYAGQLGGVAATSGDSSISQTFTVGSGGGTLSFWYQVHCDDTVAFDWATATLKDNATSTTTTLLPHTCTKPAGPWVQVTVNLAAQAGHSVTLTLTSHDDGFPGDPTYTIYDDVVFTPAGPVTNNFSISASPTSVSVAQGASGTSTISTALVSGSAESISLAASGLPSGVTAGFSPASVSAGGSSTLTLTASGGATLGGPVTVTITGTAASAIHSTTLALTVTAPVTNNFSISASPTSVSVAQGASGTSTISTALVSGSAESISLAASGLPSGVTAGFSPASVSAGGSSTLTLTASGGATLGGPVTVTITGTAASAIHSTTLALTVTAPVTNNFSISASPTSVSVAQGASGTSTISTALVSGSAESISLAASGLPSGVTAGFSPASVSAGGSSTLTLTASGGATLGGPVTVTITGTAASAIHSTTLALTVTAPVSNVIVNGGFETGTFAGWTTSGAVTSIVTSPVHSGSYAGQLGGVAATSGDSSISQTFTVGSGGGTLSFWYQVHCDDTVAFDWATATLKDNATSTTTTLLPHTCTKPAGPWVQVTVNLAAQAGHSVTLTLTSHDDGFPGDPTYTIYDDVVFTPAGPVTNNFSISASPTSVSVAQGASGTSTISTALVSGSAESISLAASGLPSGVTAGFSPASVSAGGSSTLTLTASGGATLGGPVTVTITGTAASAIHSTTLALTVTAPVTNNFSISASPTSVSVAQGASGTSTISTALVSGSAESISLAASGLPSGVTAGFSPASVSAGGSSTLTLTASGGATLGGPVTVTITGTAASAIHSTTLALTVTAPVSNVIVNGGFETGTFAGWTTSGAVTSIVTSPVHSGSYAGQLGGVAATSGDSSISQTFTVGSGGGTLSFWYQVHCDDTVAFDWATATLKDNATSTTTTLLPHTCTKPAGPWVQVTVNLAAQAGHSVTLTLTSHDDGFPGDPTYTIYDDVVFTPAA